MIPKKATRFSERVMLEQRDETMIRLNLIGFVIQCPGSNIRMGSNVDRGTALMDHHRSIQQDTRGEKLICGSPHALVEMFRRQQRHR
jgi:hypothetical protein